LLPFAANRWVEKKETNPLQDPRWTGRAKV